MFSSKEHGNDPSFSACILISGNGEATRGVPMNKINNNIQLLLFSWQDGAAKQPSGSRRTGYALLVDQLGH